MFHLYIGLKELSRRMALMNECVEALNTSKVNFAFVRCLIHLL